MTLPSSVESASQTRVSGAVDGFAATAIWVAQPPAANRCNAPGSADGSLATRTAAPAGGSHGVGANGSATTAVSAAVGAADGEGTTPAHRPHQPPAPAAFRQPRPATVTPRHLPATVPLLLRTTTEDADDDDQEVATRPARATLSRRARGEQR